MRQNSGFKGDRSTVLWKEANRLFLRTRENRHFYKRGKTAHFVTETKPPVLNEAELPFSEIKQNHQYCGRGKTADSVNESKPPIFYMSQNRQF